MKSLDKNVNKFLIDIQSTFPDKAKTVEQIRSLFIKENPEINERIKYGGIVFHIEDSLIGGIFVYKQHITIEFSNGAQFIDDGGFLEGKGKLRRHVKIIEKADVAAKKISTFIKQALKQT